MRRLAEDADRSGLFLPSHHSVVRDIAPYQTAKVTEPHRTFVEATPCGDSLDRGIAEHERLKTRVQRLDVGVGVAHDHRFLLYELSGVGAALHRDRLPALEVGLGQYRGVDAGHRPFAAQHKRELEPDPPASRRIEPGGGRGDM